MSPLSPPAGYKLHSLPTGPAWIRPTTSARLIPAWQKLNPKLPLRQAARRHPEHRLFTGRAPVVLLPIPSTTGFIVRPCVHGGIWGKFSKDLYGNAGRALQEIDRASLLTSKKIPTPQILAALFYPAGGLWRIDIVTTYIPESTNFATFLSTRPSAPARARAYAAIRKLFQICARHQVHHPDMNARNLLLAGSPLRAYLLDVDAIEVQAQSPQAVDTANRNRLLRSLLKLARLGSLQWSEKEVSSLWHQLFPKR